MALTLDGTAGITFPNSSTQLVAGAPLTTPSFTTTIGVGAATASASGAGVTFPATQSASSDANTLDDYEEGTFTPNLAFGGGSSGMTYSIQTGSYIKIGRLVFVSINIQLTALGSSTGSSTITNLPFSALGGNAYGAGLSLAYSTGMQFQSGYAMWITNGTNVINFNQLGVTGTGSYNQGNFSNSSGFQISGCYYTNS